MKHNHIKPIALTVLVALLAACSTHKIQERPRKIQAAAPKPRVLAKRTMPVMPPVYFPPSSSRTIGDVLQAYGRDAVARLKPHFDSAGVTYPPRAITLLALKAEKRLELWARDEYGYKPVRTYMIQAASGGSGPKLREGDRQVPEGIYQIVHLNPNSNYHLSMKLDYPNEFDRYHAQQEGRSRLGGDIYIHGKDVSIGCLALGDTAIEELFVLVSEVGKENTKVVIAPHDPRTQPLLPPAPGTPAWVSELYDHIELQVAFLQPPRAHASADTRKPPRRF